MSLEITKTSAAQRQIDAAIRILFSGEDVLAVHTVASAALGILKDLAKKRGISLLGEQSIEDSYKKHLSRFEEMEEEERIDLEEFKKLVNKRLRRPANFLKHADRDAKKSLKLEYKEMDDLLIECGSTYVELGFELTVEMSTFGCWYLSVYPREDSDEIHTAAGYVHNLPRDDQIEFGDFLLTQFIKHSN